MTRPHYLLATIYSHLLKHPRLELTNHTAHKLLHSLGRTPSISNISVSLCHAVKMGMLKVDRRPCPCCLKLNNYYTLTDKGRIHANRLTHT